MPDTSQFQASGNILRVTSKLASSCGACAKLNAVLGKSFRIDVTELVPMYCGQYFLILRLLLSAEN